MAFWLVGGLVAGIALGLLLGWVVWPAEFTEATPTHLDESYQKDYLIMIAAAYSLDEELQSARSRLVSLGRENVDEWLLSIIENHILNGGAETDIRQLVKLATAMGLQSPVMELYQSNTQGAPSE
jgi:hypothetical protein